MDNVDGERQEKDRGIADLLEPAQSPDSNALAQMVRDSAERRARRELAGGASEDASTSQLRRPMLRLLLGAHTTPLALPEATPDPRLAQT
ncbi:hypothetical protein E2C01_056703 [Portunus trituberculatus]|uniref:Uncharacterized protein n=1 Tax=Portunus trituberculatus TaxID=210409 RepID=A0A5B7H1C0_PORTR|nr:hypothetical protein [Portunus trituberculatus]